MKKFCKIILPTLVAFVVAIAGFSASAFASDQNINLSLSEGAAAARCSECPADLFGDSGVFRTITQILLYILGIVAVIMLIWGGLRYILSGGDAKKVTDAKNTVLYAIIGLIIAFLAYAIVSFVISALPSSKNPTTIPETTQQETQNQ